MINSIEMIQISLVAYCNCTCRLIIDGYDLDVGKFELFQWMIFGLNHISMMTSSNGNLFRVTGHLRREFIGDRWPHKGQWRGALMFFYLRLNERLSKQSWGRWFETPSHALWRYRNEVRYIKGRDCCWLFGIWMKYECNCLICIFFRTRSLPHRGDST